MRTLLAALLVTSLLGPGCANRDDPRMSGSNPPNAPRHVPREIDVGPTRGVYHLSNEITPEQAAELRGEQAAATQEVEETPVAEVEETPVAEPAAADDAEPADVAAPAPSAPLVALARFTTAVEDREPIDAVSFLESESREILFFTDLRNLSGQTITHRWEYGGEVMAEVSFEVGGNRWRVWSSKKLDPKWVGDWTASVVAADGEVLASETFSYQAKP